MLAQESSRCRANNTLWSLIPRGFRDQITESMFTRFFGAANFWCGTHESTKRLELAGIAFNLEGFRRFDEMGSGGVVFERCACLDGAQNAPAAAAAALTLPPDAHVSKLTV